MLFYEDRCPECGKPVSHLLEVVPVQVSLQKDEKGGYEYADSSDIWWDDQKPDEGPNHEVCVYCEEGHSWMTSLKHEEPRTFLVRWEIEVDATSPEAAAEIADELMEEGSVDGWWFDIERKSYLVKDGIYQKGEAKK